MENPYRAAASPFPKEEEMKRGNDLRHQKRVISSNDSDDDSDEEMGKYRHEQGRRTSVQRGADVTTIPTPSRPPPSKTRRSMYLQIIMAIAAIGCFLLGVLLKYRNLSSGIIWGSVLSAFSVLTVLISYASDPLTRQHPNPLVFWRTIADGFFVVRLLSEQFVRCVQYECSPLCVTFNCGCAHTFDGSRYLPAGHDTCIFFSGFFQFSLLASECWFLCMTLNLFLSLTNPFTDFKRNTRYFHLFSWGFGLLTSILLMSLDNFAGHSDFDTCWTNALRNFNVPPLTDQCVNENRTFILKEKVGSLQVNYISWVFFYIPMLFFILVGLVVWIWTYNRLREGLPETYGVRKQSIDRARFLVLAVSTYWTIIFIVYATYLSLSDGITKERWKEVVNFLMASKGYVDLVIWFQLNDFRIPKLKLLCSKNDDFIDIDLNPQVNAALRREVLFYTTSGIIQAVQQAETLNEMIHVQHLALSPQGITDPILLKKFTKTFHDYEPHAFRRIRQCFGINNINYLKSLSCTAKERLSEGASGAFMFFSGDGSLLVKSTSTEECNFLRTIANEYSNYLCENKNSLLTKFYGCHCLELYGKKFSFVVMSNLFHTKQIIHSRYDIKGSWINRNGNLPKSGKKITCRHCNSKYIYNNRKKENYNCNIRLGGHEPNIVLKDNDLKEKLKLNKKNELYKQLKNDSNFLYNYGIMDYSLLIGIHDIEFNVENNNYENNKKTGKRIANTVVGHGYYHLGIIDILQKWTYKKKIERFFKIYIKRMDGDGLSAIEPEKYKKRFQLKMAEILNVTDLLNQENDIENEMEKLEMMEMNSYLHHTGSYSEMDENVLGHIHL